MTLLALVAKLATRRRHLHCLQIWPPDVTTCITCKLGHHMVPLMQCNYYASGAIWWPTLQQMQVMPPGGQNLQLMQVAPFGGQI